MELATFKQQQGIDKLKLYKSQTEGSSRLSAKIGDIVIVTTSDFDPSKPAFVYEATGEKADQALAEGNKLHWLSNKAGREADIEL